jgi:hypothetical protein
LQVFVYQLSNGIPITTWKGEDNDLGLIALIPLLNKLKDVQDVRHVIPSSSPLHRWGPGIASLPASAQVEGETFYINTRKAQIRLV